MNTDELTINYTEPVVEDMTFQRRFWVAERLFWGLMAVVIAAALAGIFAGGPLSRAEKQAGALHVAYERFGRYSLPALYHVTLNQNAPLQLSDSFHDYYRLRITPTPVREAADAGGVVYFFDSAAPAQLAVRIEATPVKAGTFSGTIAVGADSRIALTQFIYR